MRLHALELSELPELGPALLNPHDASRVLTLDRRSVELPWQSVPLDFHEIEAEPVRKLSGLALPPVQSRGIAMIAAGHLTRIREQAGVSIAIENSPRPRPPHPGELNDGEFLREVAEQADCGIVLDLDRPLPATAHSGRDVLRVFSALPVERVLAVRIAAGSVHQRRGTLAAAVSRLPCLRAILVTPAGEAPGAGFGWGPIGAELARIWQLRGRTRLRFAADQVDPQTGNTVPPTRFPTHPDSVPRSSRLLTGRRQRGSSTFQSPG
jgi:hypothetical protein